MEATNARKACLSILVLSEFLSRAFFRRPCLSPLRTCLFIDFRFQTVTRESMSPGVDADRRQLHLVVHKSTACLWAARAGHRREPPIATAPEQRPGPHHLCVIACDGRQPASGKGRLTCIGKKLTPDRELTVGMPEWPRPLASWLRATRVRTSRLSWTGDKPVPQAPTKEYSPTF